MRSFALCFLILACTASPGVPAYADDVSAPTDDDDGGVDALRARWEGAPDDVEAGIAFQDALVALGRSREAATLFRRASNAEPKLQGLAFLYGRALGGRDGLRRMRKALTSGLDAEDVAPGQRAAAWRALRGVLIDAGDFEGAEPAARAAVRLGATAHDWTLLGWTLERLDRAAEAAEAYASAIQEREDHLWARNALALLRAKSGEHDAALALARKTTELFPDAASARLHLGLVACLAGDPEAGRIAYAEALERAGRDVSTLVAVATAYVDVEDHELAWKALQRALAVEPGNARALVTAGVLSLAQGKLPEAEEFLSRAVKVSRHDARAWHLLGLSAQRQGDVKDAIRAFRKANKLKPDVLEYRVALALAYAEAGTLDAGITALKRALELAPTRADLYLQLGFLQIKRKKNADALRSMKRMVELAPEDPRPHFYLAIIYGDHLGKKRDAKRELESYVELGGNEPAALRWLEELRAGK